MNDCFKCAQLKLTLHGKEKEIASLKQANKELQKTSKATEAMVHHVLKPLVGKYMEPASVSPSEVANG